VSCDLGPSQDLYGGRKKERTRRRLPDGLHGCLQCKKALYELIVADLMPLQTRWRDLETRPDVVRDVLRTSAARGAADCQGDRG